MSENSLKLEVVCCQSAVALIVLKHLHHSEALLFLGLTGIVAFGIAHFRGVLTPVEGALPLSSTDLSFVCLRATGSIRNCPSGLFGFAHNRE